MFKLFYEDLEEGKNYHGGTCLVDKQEGIDFATRYDPQPFHIDEETAKNSVFGGLCVSGWHTCAMIMRLHVDRMFEMGLASMGSPGVQDIKWLKPVFPGDELTLTFTLGPGRDSKSKPHLGFATLHDTVTNQKGERVMTMTATLMLLKRGTGLL